MSSFQNTRHRASPANCVKAPQSTEKDEKRVGCCDHCSVTTALVPGWTEDRISGNKRGGKKGGKENSPSPSQRRIVKAIAVRTGANTWVVCVITAHRKWEWK